MHSISFFFFFQILGKTKKTVTMQTFVCFKSVHLKMQKYYSVAPIIERPLPFVEKKGIQRKTYWYLANSNARLKISHTTSRWELTSSKATGQKCREVGLLSDRQPVSGSSDSFRAPWVCLLLKRVGELGEKRKQYSIHTVKTLNLKYSEVEHVNLYTRAVSDEV